ncbi:GDP-L-galactose phosphorylase 2-like [Gastrolobium bilobum]|uniref:GDP-L-galactose phosphorylase 2-like n=1 Tax=Gastrolobium bilobum TaxID=150636 RepID=UPI002AAF5EAE|nr:GDP-L-galactose phosphorylase 2-like [Gastrolobium bilobum]
MLTIKRVATVVSNYQEDDSDKGSLGCGRNCLSSCCLPVSKLPLYMFKKDGDVPVEDGIVESSEDVSEISFLHNLLLGQWEDRMNRGLFRYDVANCETKIILGQHGFIAQLNEGRHMKKRPTEFRVDQVLQAFDESKFNFTKVGQEEVLFMFKQSDDNKSHFMSNAQVDKISGSPNVVAINVSPIEHGHVLLIPRVLDCLPQRIDHDSFQLAMNMAKEAADPFFRLGYNSLGAFATINHLHFQAYYLAAPFPVEKAQRQIIAGDKGHCPQGVSVSQLLNYPVRGLVFEGGNNIRDLSDTVANSLVFLQNNNIPFNVLISDCGKKIYLFPQCFAERQALGEVSQEILKAQVNPAVWEISGHIVLKRRVDYDEASEAYAWKLLAEVSLSEERFQEVKGYILDAAGLHEIDIEENHMIKEELVQNYEPTTPQAASQQLPRDCLVQQ